MTHAKSFLAITMLSLLGLVSSACAPGTPFPLPAPAPEPAGSGRVQVLVTDAPPAEEVTSIMVTVSSVAIHRAVAEREREQEHQGTADTEPEEESNTTDNTTETDNQTEEQEATNTSNQTQEQEQEQEQGSGWIRIPLADNTTFDLLQIQGIHQFLGAADVAAGKYTQVRLEVTKAMVTLGDGEPQQARVPSGELRINHPFSVTPGKTTVLLLDFDAEKMVTVTGRGDIIVKPVVKLTVNPANTAATQNTRPQQRNGRPEKESAPKPQKPDAAANTGGAQVTIAGTIAAINGDIWTVKTADGEKTVDVNEAEVSGEPEVGREVKLRGIRGEGKVIAAEVRVAERTRVNGNSVGEKQD
ncbi:MAG: DUF4382 domain-containing protein [Chloroflexota bacterium]